MAQAYFSLVTTVGKIKLAASAAGGGPVVITHFAVGDGNGVETNPTAAATALVREVWRTPVESVVIDPENPSAVLVTAIIPTSQGGWWMREFGIFDDDGEMVAVAKPVSQYKPTALEGQLEDIRYEFQIIIGEAAQVTLLVDPSLLFATRSWVENRKIPMAQMMRLPWLPLVSMTLSSAPGSPLVGDAYLVPTGATGIWATNVGKIAEWNGMAWAYNIPPEGHGVSLPDGRIYERLGGTYVEKIALDVQSGKWEFGVVGGTVNAITATLTPAPVALSIGMSVVLNIVNSNTGPVTLNVAGAGALPVVNLFGAALSGRELVGPVRFTYDGTKWWASVMQPVLTANLSLYVNAATGNDSNNGTTAGTAFATIQKAVSQAQKLNLNGNTVTINVADGTYTGPVTLGALNGGNCRIIGNVANPAACVVTQPTGPSFMATANLWVVSGFKVSTIAESTFAPGCGFYAAANGAQINVSNVEIGACVGPMFFATGGGNISITGNFKITGGAPIALHASVSGIITINAGYNVVLDIPANVSIPSFANVYDLGVISGRFLSVTGAGVVTGQRYNATRNAVIDTNGAGANHFPGTTAGTTTTGGQYA